MTGTTEEEKEGDWRRRGKEKGGDERREMKGRGERNKGEARTHEKKRREVGEERIEEEVRGKRKQARTRRNRTRAMRGKKDGEKEDKWLHTEGEKGAGERCCRQGTKEEKVLDRRGKRMEMKNLKSCREKKENERERL